MMSSCWRVSTVAGFQRFMGVHDWNFDFDSGDAFGFVGPGVTHERGQDTIRKVMEFVPWKTFGRIIERHHGDSGVRTLGCADLFRVMAFAQLTWRESLRDIEVCLTANQGKLFHMGMRGIPARSTLSDALNLRDWRIYHALAMRLILRARDLYASDPLDIGLDATVYALDSTTIDLCLSLFDWAPFRNTKAAVKMHTLLDLRGAIPTFIHLSDGKMHDVNVLDILPMEPRALKELHLDASLHTLLQLLQLLALLTHRGSFEHFP